MNRTGTQYRALSYLSKSLARIILRAHPRKKYHHLHELAFPPLITQCAHAILVRQMETKYGYPNMYVTRTVEDDTHILDYNADNLAY